MADGDTTYNVPGPGSGDFTNNDGTPFTPPSGTPPAAGGGGLGSGVMGLLRSLGMSGTGLSPNVLAALASIAPALVSAKKQWDLSGKMLDYGREAAGRYDPFGSQRAQYQSKLAALEANPDEIKNTPGYQFALKQGLGAIQGRDNRAFGLGAGGTSKDSMDYAQGLASKTYNDTIAQLSSLSGSQFGPTGQSLDLGGMQANVALKNQALQSLFAPLGIAMAPQPNVTNNNNNAGGGQGSAPVTPRIPGTVGGTPYQPGPPGGTGGGGLSGDPTGGPVSSIVDASGRPIGTGGQGDNGNDPWEFTGPGE